MHFGAVGSGKTAGVEACQCLWAGDGGKGAGGWASHAFLTSLASAKEDEKEGFEQ